MAGTHLRELERLLARLRHAKAGQTYFDMWEHHGAGSASDEERALADVELAECNRIYADAKAALEVLVPALRSEASHEIDAWVDLHDAYLAWVIADHIARGDTEAWNFDRARRDQAEWPKVRAGELVFVNESVHYGPEGRARYRELFGFDLE